MDLADNVAVTHNGNDISTWVIEYTRTHKICSGVGTLEVIVPRACAIEFRPWDAIRIYEYGDLVGKFYIEEAADSAKNGVIKIGATDGSKKLTDYFVTDTYESFELTTTGYWIGKILDEADIDYNTEDLGEGQPVNPNTKFGLDSAYNIIQGLLQQSGWYLFFDEDGTAIIGELGKSMGSVDYSIDDTNIIKFEREQDDARLRNRAVVWGNANPEIGEQVFVDIKVPSPYVIDGADERAVVLANGSIYSNAEARTLAHYMLKEFIHIKDEKTLVTVSSDHFEIGDVIRVDSRYWNGSGLLTTLEVSFNKEGLIHTLTLNEKCPRLFTYFGLPPTGISGFYVYIGTEGEGVWRRWTEDTTWTNVSFGLEDLNVRDLIIRDGVAACVASDGSLYTKPFEEASWNKYIPPILNDLTGNPYSPEELSAVACSINDTGNIIAGYTASGISTSGLGFVLQLTPYQELFRAEQITVSGLDEFAVVDLEAATAEENIISISGFQTAISGYSSWGISAFRVHGWGEREIQMGHLNWYEAPDSRAYAYGPNLGHSDLSLVPGHAGNAKTNVVYYDDHDLWYATTGGMTNFHVEGENSSISNYAFTVNSTVQSWGGNIDYSFIHRKSSNQFDLLWAKESGFNLDLVHCVYTLGGSLVEVYNNTIPQHGYAENIVLQGNSLYWFAGGYTDGFWKAWYTEYNLTSHTYVDVQWLNDSTSYQYPFPVSAPVAHDGDNIVVYYVGVEPQGIINWNCGLFLNYSVPTYFDLYLHTLTISRYGTQSISSTYIDSVVGALEGVSDIEIHHFPAWSSDVGNNTVYLRFVVTWYDVSGVGDCLPDLSAGYSGITYYISDNGTVSKKIEHYNDGVVSPDPNGIDLYYYTDSTHRGMWAFDTLPVFTRYNGPYAFSNYYNPTTQEEQFNLINMRTGTHMESGDYLQYAEYAYQQEDIFNALWFFNPDYEIDNIHEYSNYTGSSSSFRTITIDNDSYNFHTIIGGVALWGVFGRWAIAGYSTEYINELPNANKILRHRSLPAETGASPEATEQTVGVFDVILEPPKACKVEISKGVPTVVYSVTVSGEAQPSFYASSVSNDPLSFYTRTEPLFITDARVIDIEDPQNFPTSSGIFEDPDFQRYVSFATDEGWQFTNYQMASNFVTVASGVVDKIESTNYTVFGPYLFFTASGVKSFYQKNPMIAGWQDYSATLPDAPINIIRCDDII